MSEPKSSVAAESNHSLYAAPKLAFFGLNPVLVTVNVRSIPREGFFDGSVEWLTPESKRQSCVFLRQGEVVMLGVAMGGAGRVHSAGGIAEWPVRLQLRPRRSTYAVLPRECLRCCGEC